MIINQNGQKINQINYKNEAALQQIIFDHPELLNYSSELISVGREIETGAGPLDVLMISSKGDVVVVEVKLGRNHQSRREVVAQIMDYISTMTQYSYHELDEHSHNRLSAVVDLQNQITDLLDLPKTIDSNLRHGKVHLVLAVDEANEDLHRIMQFLADHSDFNLALIEIKQLKNAKDEILYSSNTIIETRDRDPFRDSINENLERVSQSWNQISPNLPVVGSGRTFRQIHPQKWPSGVHYEFYSNPVADHLDIRLDNELNIDSPKCKAVNEALSKFEDTNICNYKITLDHNNNKILRARIRVDIKNIEDITKITQEFIKITKDSIDKIFLKIKP